MRDCHFGWDLNDENAYFVTAVVKVADDVRGHSTDSLIHKDHVDVVTVALIHFVALIHG